MDSIGKSFNPNKHLKEEFVSHLTGSSMLELVALSTIVPVPHALGLHGYAVRKKSWVGFGYMMMIVSDFCLVIVPILLILTVLSGWTYEIAVLLLLPLLLSFKRGTQARPDSIRQSISSCRVAMMDLGVGSFVLANALVSREARNLTTSNWRTTITSTSPLIILGKGHLVSTTGVNYQVHVGEYGVHWNFFFTLAAVAMLTSIVKVPSRYCGALGSVILFGYQLWLSHGLNSCLLSDERANDITSQNKEGIYSVLGHWGMYLVGVQLGGCLFFGSLTVPSRSSRWTMNRMILTVVLDKHVERISRRTCNLPYVTAAMAQKLQVLALVMLCDLIPGYKSSVIVEVTNHNLLATFLLVTLLAGLVNMLMDKLNASSLVSLVVLAGYAFLLCITIGLAHFGGFRLKFW